MTELERWMNDHPPLADALTAEETAALRAKVLARRPTPRVLQGWRLAAAAGPDQSDSTRLRPLALAL